MDEDYLPSILSGAKKEDPPPPPPPPPGEDQGVGAGRSVNSKKRR